MDRYQVEEIFGKGTKFRAHQLADRIEMGKLILKRIDSGVFLHYEEQDLIDACDRCLSGYALTAKQDKIWRRYANK